MTQQSKSSPDCETLRALIPAYSVGATDTEETALVEQLLPDCPEAAAELEQYQSLAQAMLYTAPRAQPPAHLHDQLMAAARASQPQPQTAPRPSMQAMPIVQPRLTAHPRRRINNAIAAFALVAAALLIVSNAYWVAQVNNLRVQQEQTTALLQSQEQALTSLGTGRAQRLQLVSTSDPQKGVLATVLYNPDSNTALLYSNHLPQLSADKTYQLWVIKDAQPISAGTFEVDSLGVGVLIFQPAQSVNNYNTVAITAEPAGGSDQPTTTPLAAAQVLG